MSSVAQVWLFGSDSGTSSMDGVPYVPAAELPLNQTPAERLNTCVSECDSDFFALADNDTKPGAGEILSAARLLIETPSAAAALVPLPAGNTWIERWRRFPQRLAGLIESPDRRAVLLIRVDAIARVGPFADVTNPLWDWLIRAVREAGPVVVMPASPLEESSRTDSRDLPALAPERPTRNSDWILSHLNSVRPEELVSNIDSAEDAVALKASLLQIHDYLDESHQLSQSVQGLGRHAAGDYWHAIMHRREPDYSNAKYWFRRVGRHPVFEPLALWAADILAFCQDDDAEGWSDRLDLPVGWDPAAFVDLCEACDAGASAELHRAAREIQWMEMQLLLDQTFRDASA